MMPRQRRRGWTSTFAAIFFVPALAVARHVRGRSSDTQVKQPAEIDGSDRAATQQPRWMQGVPDMWLLDWNVALLTAIAEHKIGPTKASRLLFLGSSAQYDAWQVITPGIQGSDGLGTYKCEAMLKASQEERLAWLEAADRVIWRNLFTTHNLTMSNVIATEDKHARQASAGMQALLNSTVASPCFTNFTARVEEYLLWRAGDGSKEADVPVADPPMLNLHVAIVAYNDTLAMAQDCNALPGPKQWTPIAAQGPGGPGTVATQHYLTPEWGRVRDLLSKEEKQGLMDFMVGKYPSKEQQERDVDDLLRISGDPSRLNDTTKVLAEFWAGAPGTVGPPGAWNVMSVWLAQALDLPVDDQVVLLWAVNQAIFEVSVITWGVKRMFVQERPIQNIRKRYRGQLVKDYRGQWIDGAAWLPYQEDFVITPPFPDYPSGHSSYSNAAATVITSLFGTDKIPRAPVDGSLSYLINPYFIKKERVAGSVLELGTVHFGQGTSGTQPRMVPKQDVELKWDTWTQMAADAGISRIYGGIHGEYANGPSLVLGQLVGDIIYSRAEVALDGEARLPRGGGRV